VILRGKSNGGPNKYEFGGLFLAVLLGVQSPQARAEDTSSPLLSEKTISLDDVSGRIDHMAFDHRRNRLIVAELGNNTVDVVNVASGTKAFRLNGLNEPQGVAYLAKTDVILVSNGASGDVRLFKAEDGSAVSILELGNDADNVRLGPGIDSVLVGYGDGGLALLDADRRKKIVDVKLPAHPEAFEIARDGQTVFVNVPDAGQIDIVSLKTGKVTANWDTGDVRSNFPMALDAKDVTLAVAFRHPARLELLDPSTGKRRQVLETCDDADDVFFDQKRDRIYLSCGEGFVDVFQKKDTDYELNSRIATASGARTSLFVPELDRLFVAAPARLLSGARILVYKPNSGR
jgi:hypothetical protein